jgi:GTP cyclohydrolase I
LRLTFSLPLLRPSLVSELRGQRLYDCCLEAVYTQDQGLQVRQQVKVLYSSTCPASAALAREKLVQNLRQQFGTGSSDKVDLAVLEDWLRGGGMASVTPHAQRSLATVIIQVSEGKILAWEDFLDLIETTLQTPVQTAVKRADELEFAVRNGQNLMFCEDAARRLGTVFSALNTVNGFLIKVEHFESLHPHNAVAMCRGPGDLNFL